MTPLANRVLLCALCALAGVLAWQHQSKLFEDKGRLGVAVKGQTAVLSWSSKVELPMARRIKEAFDQNSARVKRFVLVLHSPGGALHEGGEVIGVLEQIKRTHQLITFVGAKQICLSMCVPIYLQGQERLASPESKWMFHEPIYLEAHTGDEVKKPKFEKDFFARRFFNRYFANSAMDPAWRTQLEKDWKGKEVWKTGQQLFAEKSNIITRLVLPEGENL